MWGLCILELRGGVLLPPRSLIVSMSFRLGYSLDGCSPAEPSSASPTGSSISEKSLAGNDLSANGNQCHYYLSQA